MITILPLNKLIKSKIQKYSLQKKFDKQIKLLSPKEYGIYSFRIDLKYRALFIYHKALNAIEVVNITVHYH